MKNELYEDPRKQVLCSRKIVKVSLPLSSIRNTTFSQTNSHKQFGIALDSELLFKNHLELLKKIIKTVVLLFKPNTKNSFNFYFQNLFQAPFVLTKKLSIVLFVKI